MRRSYQPHVHSFLFESIEVVRGQGSKEKSTDKAKTVDTFNFCQAFLAAHVCICVKIYAALHFQKDEGDVVYNWLKQHMVTLTINEEVLWLDVVGLTTSGF